VFDVFKKKHICIAHRGYRAFYPENTILAFKAAIKYFDMFEFDVQYTKDKIPVVFHDESLLRTTNVKEIFKRKSYNLSEFTYEEIKKLDNVSWFIKTNPFNKKLDYNILSFPKNSIPLLDEVLLLIKKYNFPANLEIKPSFLDDEFIVNDILQRIEKFEIKHLILISSFNHNYIKIINGFYKAALFDKKTDNLVKYIKLLNVDAYHIDKFNVSKKDVADLLDIGVFTNVYTVNDNLEQKKLFETGVKGVFCDYFS